MDDAERIKHEHRQKLKYEVRKRLEEASKKTKASGFLTTERKKKLKKLLREANQAAVLRELERKTVLRKKVIAERCGQPKDVDGDFDLKELQSIVAGYHQRIVNLEEAKYDLEYEVRQKDFMLNELTIQVNELRGKFVKPVLKKISKFDKLKKSIKANDASATENLHFSRQSLKAVKKKVKLEEKEKTERPEWAAQKSCPDGVTEL